MKTEFHYIFRRVLVGLILACIFGAIKIARGQEAMTATAANTGGYQGFPAGHGLKVRVHNPTGASSMTLTSQNNPTFPSGYRVSWGFADSTNRVVPAGGFVDFPVGGGVSATTLNGTYTWGHGNLPLCQLRQVGGAGTIYTCTVIAKNYTITQAPGSAVTVGGSNLIVAELYVSPPPPSAKITINADAAAAGARTWQIGNATPSNVTLVQGANVVLQNSTPANYADGAVVTVKQSGSTIGTGTIAKDSNGNFNLQIAATGIPTQGKLTISWPAEFNGKALVIKETGQPDTNIPAGTVSPYVSDYLPASLVANGTVYKVYQATNLAGSGTVVYGTNGSWAVNIVLQGKGDSPPGPKEALFTLDLAAYNGQPVSLTLLVDGVAYSVATILGDPVKGVRTVQSYRLDNTAGNLSGKSYSWQITGTVGEDVYSNSTIAGGITPQKTVGGDPPVENVSFRVDNSGIISGDVPNPSTNPYNPDAPPVHDPGATPEEIAQAEKRVEEKRDDYEATNKAVGDALNQSTVSDAKMPNSGQGMEGAKLGATAAGEAKGITDGAGSSAGEAQKPVGDWTGTSDLTVSLSGLGTFTLSAGDYGSAPGVIRAIALMALLWMYYKFCISIFRGSMV